MYSGSGRIHVVQQDTLPYINMYLKKSDGTVLDISDPGVVVSVLFRESGSTTNLSTIICVKPNGGADGFVRFNFDGGVLDVTPGYYEGEVVVDFGGGELQTIYDLLKFTVRQR